MNIIKTLMGSGYQTRRELMKEVSSLRSELSATRKQLGEKEGRSLLLGIDRELLAEAYWQERTISVSSFYHRMAFVAMIMTSMAGMGEVMIWKIYGLSWALAGMSGVLAIFLWLFVQAMVAGLRNYGIRNTSVALPSGEVVEVSDQCVATTKKILARMCES
jgi:hypothetical protein